jgi:hypothetical protein
LFLFSSWSFFFIFNCFFFGYFIKVLYVSNFIHQFKFMLLCFSIWSSLFWFLTFFHLSIQYIYILTHQWGYFAGAFNTFTLHQTWQNLHENDHLTFDFTSVWSVLVDWHHSNNSASLKWPTLPAFFLLHLTVYNAHFEPIIEIIYSWTKG